MCFQALIAYWVEQAPHHLGVVIMIDMKVGTEWFAAQAAHAALELEPDRKVVRCQSVPTSPMLFRLIARWPWAAWGQMALLPARMALTPLTVPFGYAGAILS